MDNLHIRTLDQNKRIWKLVSTLVDATGFSRDYASERMHDICEEISGSRSSSRLSEDQAGQLIQRLEGIIRTARKVGCKQEAGGRSGQPGHDAEALATNAQLAVLNRLFLDVGMDTDERQIGFCQRVLNSCMPITRGDVAKVHEALEAMYVRQFDDAMIDNMLALCIRGANDEGRLTSWEKGFIGDLYRQVRANGRSPLHKKLSSMKLKKLKEIHEKAKRDVL